MKTILGGFVIRKFLGLWTLITKSIGLVSLVSIDWMMLRCAVMLTLASQCLAVGSGMWLGKEGPFVHVACCVANLFTRPFRNISENEGRLAYLVSYL